MTEKGGAGATVGAGGVTVEALGADSRSGAGMTEGGGGGGNGGRRGAGVRSRHQGAWVLVTARYPRQGAGMTERGRGYDGGGARVRRWWGAGVEAARGRFPLGGGNDEEREGGNGEVRGAGKRGLGWGGFRLWA